MAKASAAGRAAKASMPVAMKRVIALMNSGAGAFSQALAAEVEHELTKAFSHFGVTADLRFVDGNGLHDAAKRALAEAKGGEAKGGEAKSAGAESAGAKSAGAKPAPAAGAEAKPAPADKAGAGKARAGTEPEVEPGGAGGA